MAGALEGSRVDRGGHCSARMVLSEGDSGAGTGQDEERKQATHSLERAVSFRLDFTRGRVAWKTMTLKIEIKICVCARAYVRDATRRANVQ